MNILPRILTFLLHEKSRITLNEFLNIPQKLLILYTVPNRMVSYRNFHNLLFLRRNINKGIITRGKSTQSSCEKDNTEQHRKCIKDHQQAAESCNEPREWRSDGYQIPTESYRKICSDLLRHECESSQHGSSDKSRQTTQIISEKWICGKPATEGKIYYKCKPKPCVYPESREKTVCFPSTRDYCKNESDEIAIDKSKQITTYPKLQRRSESKLIKKIILNEKKTSPVKYKTSEDYPPRDTYEYYIKPDPPPPKPQHWSENPPSYYDRCLKKTCSSPVKASPIISISEKGPRKSRAKDTASSMQNIRKENSRSPNENECRTDAKTLHLQKSVSKKCVISFEDKCAASLTVPAPVNKTMESKIQQFHPMLTKDGQCCVEKPEKFVTSDISDCSPNTASLKYRLSKCPCIKEMWGTDVKREPPVDVSVRQKQRTFLPHCKKMKRPEPKTAKRKGRKVKSRTPGNGWTRQRYKFRLKIFQKGNECLDPCLPRIVELICPRGEKMRPKLLKPASDKGESSSRSRNSCPRYRPTKTPISKTKSYPTKMNESRVIRDQYVGKHPCEKHR